MGARLGRLLVGLFLVAAVSAAETMCYLIESSIQAGGRTVGASVSLAKRVLDRDAGRIEEHVLSLRGSEPAQEFITLLKVDGSKVVLSSVGGEIEGEGELSGPAWNWTGMKFTARLPKTNQRMEAEDHFLPDGMTARKQLLGPNGKLLVTIVESGRIISEPAYNILRTRLSGGKPSAERP